MPRVQLGDYGTSRPKLMPEDLDESPCVLTVASAEEVEVPDAGKSSGVRKALTLMFIELPDRVLWLNRTQIETLIQRLGDDTDHWPGAAVPLEAHTAEYRGKEYPKVRVVPDEEWDSILGSTKRAGRVRSIGSAKGNGGRR